ncbi:helix-turn-helix domain containing protein [Microbacterium horticulturae]|uniref:Helix-turn-helix domain containing protein n=1 Tax=Microbacterium horticulturae TaxID=3028316 RepID=A0ABY8BYP8_9MICO|nr:TetR/AcrR family transcriptional regulator [Microbacterium sp. KACC 23027]WEG09324.1 helix-turn-helix domain containing protein [Microbacterium sp. KACC 23027]
MTQTLGLRERKRADTRRRIERAAIEIVDDHGLDALTIDAISERADVSPRTFFNYFDSKEDAVLGLRPEDDTRRTVAEVVGEVPAGPLPEQVIDLLVRVSDGPGLDRDIRDRRHRVIHAHPALLQRHFLHMGRMLAPLTDGVAQLVAHADGVEVEIAGMDAAAAGTANGPIPGCGDDRAVSNGPAEILLMMCGAALRSAMLDLTRERADLTTDESAAELRVRATALLHDTIERLR